MELRHLTLAVGAQLKELGMVKAQRILVAVEMQQDQEMELGQLALAMDLNLLK